MGNRDEEKEKVPLGLEAGLKEQDVTDVRKTTEEVEQQSVKSEKTEDSNRHWGGMGLKITPLFSRS